VISVQVQGNLLGTLFQHLFYWLPLRNPHHRRHTVNDVNCLHRRPFDLGLREGNFGFKASLLDYNLQEERVNGHYCHLLLLSCHGLDYCYISHLLMEALSSF